MLLPTYLFRAVALSSLAHLAQQASAATSPFEILKSSQGLEITFETSSSLGSFDYAFVDRLELRAANRALLNIQSGGVPVPVPDPEGNANPNEVSKRLFKARDELFKKKMNLYGQPLLDLLKSETDLANRRMRLCAAASKGSFTSGHVAINVTGNITIEGFLAIIGPLFNTDGLDEEGIKQIVTQFAFPAHPEHYEVIAGASFGVTETWGGIPTRSFVDPTATLPAFVSQYRDESFPMAASGHGFLQDNTTVTWTLQQFKETATGLAIDLRIWYPSACPPEYVHDHVEHFCVEYRNGLVLAAGSASS
ncbi:hypothetical protein BJX62DRAFT_233944 [Aspergillus germanicus]